jgi:hypothetical protein
MAVDLWGLCRRVVALYMGLLASACAAARITPVGNFGDLDATMTTVALAPQGGLFADLVGFDLAQRGCTIIDTGGTLALLVLMQKSAAELEAPEVMQGLAQRGIQAVLSIDKVAGEDQGPDLARAREQATSPVAELGGIDWQNRWGKRSPVEAAHEIASALAKQLCQSTDAAPSDPSREATENPAP